MQAREAAYNVLLEVEKGAYANLALDEFLRLKQLSTPDRALMTEIVYGTIKYQLKLDWIINQLVQKPAKLESGARLLLRLSFYQLLFLDRVPAAAVTNEAVKLAKKKFHGGVAGLVNGVLRNYLRNPGKISWPDAAKEPLDYLEICCSHPRWLAARWLKRFGFAKTKRLCEFNNAPPDLWVRTNTLRCSREELMERLNGAGCTLGQSAKVPEGILLKTAPPLSRLDSFTEGLFMVQDESSMLAAHALSPLPGQMVLDMCAAPGGKSTHLAQLMGNKGKIFAWDVHKHRLGLIEENAQRLGVTIIKTILADAAISPAALQIETETETNNDNQDKDKNLKQADQRINYEDKYDLILVDAPCSGLGVLRRRPDSRWRKKEEDIKTLAALQRQILTNALRLLKTGGRLVYSTCTLEPEENEENLAWLLRNHPEVCTLNLQSYLSYEAETDAERDEWACGYRQYLPFADNMEGFFIAVLKKTK